MLQPFRDPFLKGFLSYISYFLHSHASQRLWNGAAAHCQKSSCFPVEFLQCSATLPGRSAQVRRGAFARILAFGSLRWEPIDDE
jgi:hypothetical protein